VWGTNPDTTRPEWMKWNPIRNEEEAGLVGNKKESAHVFQVPFSLPEICTFAFNTPCFACYFFVSCLLIFLIGTEKEPSSALRWYHLLPQFPRFLLVRFALFLKFD
jgi:hypothetical protein